MLVQTSLNSHQIFDLHFHDYPWLSGAAFGLQSLVSVPDELARDLVEEIRALGITPVAPGESYSLGDGTESSAYDVLGGYVSVTGVRHPAGLLIPIPSSRQGAVRRLVSVVHKVDENWMIVRLDDLPNFTRIVPLKGLVADSVTQLLEGIV